MEKASVPIDQLIKLSVSKTKTFDACAKSFHFSYILKLPRVSKDYHIFGQCLHKALEEFHLAYINGSKRSHNDEMGTAWKIAKSEYANKMTPEAIKEGFGILCKYLQWLSSPAVPSDYVYKVLSAEQAFNFQLTDNIILNGFIDKVHIDEDGVIHISDYKTTKQKKYLKDDWFQLMTYAFVVMHNKPEIDRVRVSYVMLRHDIEHISREISRDEAEEVKGQYMDFAHDINSETEYLPTVSQMCRFCDWLDRCEPGMKSIGKEVRHGEIDW